MWNPFRVNAPPPPEPSEPAPPPPPPPPPFNAKSKCPKCGSGSGYTRFVESKNLMNRVCMDCTAHWWETPLDRAT